MPSYKLSIEEVQCIKSCLNDFAASFCPSDQGPEEGPCLCLLTDPDAPEDALAFGRKCLDEKCEFDANGFCDHPVPSISIAIYLSEMTSSTDIPSESMFIMYTAAAEGAAESTATDDPASAAQETQDTTPADAPTSPGLPPGAKGGIAAGVTVFALMIMISLFFYRRRKAGSSAQAGGEVTEKDWSKPELDGNAVSSHLSLHPYADAAVPVVHEIDSECPTPAVAEIDSERSPNPAVAELDAVLNISRNASPFIPPVAMNIPSPRELDNTTPAVVPPDGPQILEPYPSPPQEYSSPPQGQSSPPQEHQSPRQEHLTPPQGTAKQPPSSIQEGNSGSVGIEHLLRRDEELQERRRTLQELMRVQEEQAALREKINQARARS